MEIPMNLLELEQKGGIILDFNFDLEFVRFTKMVDIYCVIITEYWNDFISCGGLTPYQAYGIFMEIPYIRSPDTEIWDNKRRFQECIWLACLAKLYLEFLMFNVERMNSMYSAPKTPEARPHRLVWWEPWSFHNYNVVLDKQHNPWELYTKYRLSIWASWHILEDRICLFAIYIYMMLL